MTNAVEVTQGDVFSLRFPLLDPSGQPAGYVGTPAAKFALGKNPYIAPGETPILSKSSPASGCRVVQETVNAIQTWVVYVDFVKVDTLGNANVMAGQHYYELKANENTVATGSLMIQPTLITS
ncbi:MAG: hypothetical protein ACR652_21170 [Methylocystis sp.]|uniref:hypothetical protein n=1 Tax=Methylocystis sp. TaxID=1911079 RepID=UPI003DA37EBD